MSLSFTSGDLASELVRVSCMYTTVFDSKASHYYAVAPKKPYEKLLSTALSADVAAMAAENGGGGACCEAGTPSYSILSGPRSSRTDAAPPPLTRSGAATVDLSVPSPCVCVEHVALTEVRKHYLGVPELLGLTLQVTISSGAARTDARTAPAGIITQGSESARVAVAAAANVPLSGSDPLTRETGDSAAPLRAAMRRARHEMSASAVGGHWAHGLAAVPAALGTNRSSVVVPVSHAPPAQPFVWTLPKGGAFPSVRQNLLRMLTRKGYLSAYRNDVHMFAHVTLSDLSAMLSVRVPSSSSETFTAQNRAASLAMGRANVTVDVSDTPVVENRQRRARRTAGELAGSERGDTDYCRILAVPRSSTAPPPGSTSTPMVMTADGKASYPIELVQVAQDAYAFRATSKCTDTTCITGAVCSLVMMVLIACATLAYVHRLWRRRKEERADELRLLQRDLR
ncbi:hypothetical protein LSCM1_08260 [Leishmania martiniquensis]|uniref:Uncharacterized protein n=1 Tax=Leishmania martiniquensis TaxID=1580590 RepID=A0A836I3Y9_9TRYP|nr:hypothetical protein LSCM1_08260 [Leishmania martiniquensis]